MEEPYEKMEETYEPYEGLDDGYLIELGKAVDTVADFLDVDKPGWRQTLKDYYGEGLDSGFDISDASCCVLSAIYGNYSKGLEVLHESLGSPVTKWSAAIASFDPERPIIETKWRSVVNG